MARRRPLPGIRFEGRTPPRRDPLPRMDVAAFVGIAASGPIDVPVPIEDIRQFAMIFGGDVPLPARPAAAGGATGHLGVAVRRFFDNGGRRCWIVRVARGAKTNTFPIPGLAVASEALHAATMEARSAGSWSDALRVRATLVARPMTLRRVNPPASPDPDPTVDVDARSTHDLIAGDLIRVTWLDPAVALYVFVRSITPAPDSPLGTPARRLSGPSFWRRADAVQSPLGPPTPTGQAAVERLSFDLTVFDTRTPQVWTMPQLGFAPEHPRYVGALPTDAVLFAQAVEAEEAPAAGGEWPDLWREAASPRFPLGATVSRALYLPVTMPAVLDDDARTGAGAMVPGGPALERDGLAVFDRTLFLDPALAATGVRDIRNTADSIRYSNGASPALLGIHAVLGIEEVSIVSVPDAAHEAWERRGVSGPASPSPSPPLDPLPPAFLDCEAFAPVPAPALSVLFGPGPSYHLRWPALAGATVEVQHAVHADWRGAVTIAHSRETRVTIHDRAAGDHYYRVRYVLGRRTSAWSSGVVVRVSGGGDGWEALPSYDPATLIDVQRALIRMCAAAGDRVALLSLPRHYDEAQAVAHAADLIARTEPAALSYAALWHPWLVGRDAGEGELRATPPDGAVAGVMAMRAAARGAWVAPANEPLSRVVALDPPIPAEARQTLQDAAVNLVRQEPYGFVCLNADTLSEDDDLRPLNVRRLLILLRRAALRAGNRFTFEPNGERLRRAVKRGFEVMLEDMFTRGAFAGRRASEAFRVSTDASLNSRASVESGRFLAEIRVAPSRPLSFLTVRLVQRGDATVVQEVR